MSLKHVGSLQIHLQIRVPPCSNTSLGYSAVRGFIPHGTSYCFTGVERVRCPCLRNGLLPFQHGGLWSRTSHARRELLRAVGLHLLPKGSHCTAADSERYININGQRDGVWPPACVTSLSGRTSRPGVLARILTAPEPTGRAACCPCLLVPPTAPYGVRPARTGTPGCRAGMRGLISLEHGRSAARSEFTRPCAQLRSRVYDWR